MAYRTQKHIERKEIERQRRAGKFKKAIKWGSEPCIALIIGLIGVGAQYLMADSSARTAMVGFAIGFMVLSLLLTLLLNSYTDSESLEARMISRQTQKRGLMAMFLGVVVAAGAERVIKMTESDGDQQRQAVEKNLEANGKEASAYETELLGFQDCQSRYDKLGRKQKANTSLLDMCGKRPEKAASANRFTDATASIRDNIFIKNIGVTAMLIAILIEGMLFLSGYFGAKTEHEELLVEKRRPTRQLERTIFIEPEAQKNTQANVEPNDRWEL